MSKHQPDLILCRKQPGISIGHLCPKCDGHCPLCDSQNLNALKRGRICRLCDSCAYQCVIQTSMETPEKTSFGAQKTAQSASYKCMICGNVAHGKNCKEAYYCRNCVLMGKDRDGCARVLNLGESRKDAVFQNDKRKQMR